MYRAILNLRHGLKQRPRSTPSRYSQWGVAAASFAGSGNLEPAWASLDKSSSNLERTSDLPKLQGERVVFVAKNACRACMRARHTHNARTVCVPSRLVSNTFLSTGMRIYVNLPAVLISPLRISHLARISCLLTTYRLCRVGYLSCGALTFVQVWAWRISSIWVTPRHHAVPYIFATKRWWENVLQPQRLLLRM